MLGATWTWQVSETCQVSPHTERTPKKTWFDRWFGFPYTLFISIEDMNFYNSPVFFMRFRSYTENCRES